MRGDETSKIGKEYNRKLRADHEEKIAWRFGNEGLHPWTNYETTDPNNHNPRKYRYLVHAVRPYDYLKPEELINHFLGKPTVSMSLITEKVMGTFYRAGFILKVPPGNIVSARPHGGSCAILADRSTEEEFQDAVVEANDIWGVWSPEDLIKYSNSEEPAQRANGNEVYAITGYKYSSLPRIEIIGVFFHKGRKYQMSADLARKFGKILNVPTVELP